MSYIMQVETTLLKRSRIGWPFWIPVLLTTIPFTVLFGILVTSSPHDPISWWEWFFAIPIGLLPALVLGLVVQTLWSIGIAAQQKRFRWFDGLFDLVMLTLGAIPGWIYSRASERFQSSMTLYFFVILYFSLVIYPLLHIYVRRRSKAKMTLQNNVPESN